MDDVSPYVKMNRSLVVKYIINKNSEDWKIAKTIADQILDFARTNGLTRSQAIEVFYEEVMSIVLKYRFKPSWWNGTFAILAPNKGKLSRLKMNTTIVS